jgi:uncharacterized membrane protein YhaH (DUF805 family)
VSWYVGVWKKYATFDGRARRKEYWTFFLFNLLAGWALVFIDNALGIADKQGNGPLYGLYSLAVLLPAIAVAVRRMHDTDHSGWWILVPVVNFVFAVTEGTSGPNRFGANPKIGSSPAPSTPSPTLPSTAAAPAVGAPVRAQAANKPRDELLKRAAELGQQYADDVSGLGDDAVAALRTELEHLFGPAAVAERWTVIRPLLASSRPKGGPSD